MKIENLADLVSSLTIAPNCLEVDAVLVKEGDWYKNLTYGDLAHSVQSLTNALHKIGVKKGDNIGILSENRMEWPIVYLAVTSMGAVIVPISILWEKQEIELVINKATIQILFTSGTYLDKISTLRPKTPSMKHLICFDHHPSTAIYTFYPHLLDDESMTDNLDFPIIKKEDTAEILFVSTSLGVKLSHGAIVSNAKGILETLSGGGHQQGKKSMIIFPLSHLYPTVFGLLVPLLANWTILMTDSGRMDKILRMIKETEPHYLLLVPILMERLYSRLSGRLKKVDFDLSKLGWHQIEWIFTAGVKCPEELIENIEQIGLTVLEGYGVSEMAPFISISTPTNHKAGSAGIPLNNLEIQIIDQDNSNCGEIIVRGPGMMQGYYGMSPTNFENAFHNGAIYIDGEGWLHTGDLGYIDKEGFLHICGRKRNIIVTKGGTNIYPTEVAQWLSDHPLIEEAEIIKHEEENTGEFPYALIKPSKEALSFFNYDELLLKLQEVIQDISGKVAAYKIPKGFEIISQS
jgi:long-chain acyl-CoA synthetase